MTQTTFWNILYYTWIASEILIAVSTRTKRGSGQRIHDRGSMAILWCVIVSSITACEWIKAATPPDSFGSADWPETSALVIMVAGLAIRWSAVFSLGKAFSANVAIRKAQALKTSGLYGFVRHPSYLGLLLVFGAIGLHTRHWLSLAFAVLPTTVAILYRIHVEELALTQAFGEEYVAYSRITKRLLPGLL